MNGAAQQPQRAGAASPNHGRRGTTKCCRAHEPSVAPATHTVAAGHQGPCVQVQSDLFHVLVRICVFRRSDYPLDYIHRREFGDHVGHSRRYWRVVRFVVFGLPGVGRRAGLAHLYVDGAATSGSRSPRGPKAGGGAIAADTRAAEQKIRELG